MALTVSGLPAGVTGTFTPASVTAGGSSTLTLAAVSTAALVSGASYTVTGTAASATHTANGTVTVTAPPTVSITAPANGATVSGSVEIDATAASGAGATLVKIELRVDDSVVGSSTASPAQAFWQSTEVPDGSHAITARAVDSNGGSTTSAAVIVTVHNAGGTTAGGGGGGCSSTGAGAFTIFGLLAMWLRRRRA